MRKILLFIILIPLITVVLASWASAEMKIGIVDAQKVFETSKAGKEAQKVLEEYVGSRQKVIDIDKTELERLQEELIKQNSVLTPEARKEKEEILNRKAGDYTRKARELEKEVNKKKEEVLTEFNKKFEEVVEALAKKEKFDLILDKNERTIIYGKESLDLTEKIIAEMDKAAK